MSEVVVVLGASPKKERYSNMAIHDLQSHGHTVIPVNPGHTNIEGIPTVSSLSQIRTPVDTLTVYVGPQHIEPLIPEILKLKPKRVILNPGTESDALESQLTRHGIPFLEACTLVLLRTKQF